MNYFSIVGRDEDEERLHCKESEALPGKEGLLIFQ